MNKAELIDAIAKASGVATKDTEKVIASTINTITAVLKKGDSLSLVGFGSFSVAKRAARKGRNPKTGAAIKIAACKVPKFSAGKTLKDAVNGVKRPAPAAPAKKAAPKKTKAAPAVAKKAAKK